MDIKSTINQVEIDKFAILADSWWDKNGPLKTLHDINPVRLEYIKKFVDLNQKEVLDLGCGGGILTESIANEKAFVTGIDAEQSVITYALNHVKKSNLNIDYICIDVAEYSAKSFDIITCMEMLEHVDKPEEIIKNTARLLKPHGYLFLSTINRTLKAYLGAIVASEYLLGILPKQTHDYDKFIKPSELIALLRHFGLELIDIQGMAYNPFSRKASLNSSLDINYILVARKIN